MRARACVWPAVFLLAAAPALWASEEAAGHGGGGQEFIGKVLNFVILFGGLGFVLFKPLRAFLRKRSEDVRRTLDDSDAERRRAEEKLKTAQARLAGLASDIETMKKAAEAEGRAEQEKIRRLAAEEAEKIRTLTKADMESRVRAGVRELKRHAAALAVQRARERIEKRMTPGTEAVLVERAIKDLAAGDEKKDSDPKVRPRAH